MTVLKFDLIGYAAKHPKAVAITYRGKRYRYYNCARCGMWFWKSGDDKGQRASRVYRVYCSRECFVVGQRALLAARQKRYRLNYDKKYGKGAYYKRYCSHAKTRTQQAKRNPSV